MSLLIVPLALVFSVTILIAIWGWRHVRHYMRAQEAIRQILQRSREEIAPLERHRVNGDDSCDASSNSAGQH